MDTGDELKGIIRGFIWDPKLSGYHDPSQLGSKQNHSRFNYNEGDWTKFIPVSDAQRFIFRGSDTPDISEDFENPEHN